MEQPRPPKSRASRPVVMPRIFAALEESEEAVSLYSNTPLEVEVKPSTSALQDIAPDLDELFAGDLKPSVEPASSLLIDPQKTSRFVEQVLTNAAILSEDKERRLRKALLEVPREPFVHGGDPWSDVQTDTPFGTLSLRPSLVARMLSLLPLRPGDRVLDVSSGVGYTLALLESMGICSFGVEKIPSQAQYSRKLLDRLNLCGSVIRAGQPYRGWSEAAPFDGIIISGPLIKVPRALFLQLNQEQGFLVCIIVTKRALRLCLYRRLKGKLSCVRLESL